MDIFVRNGVSIVMGPLLKDVSTIEVWLVRVDCTFVVAANDVDCMFVAVAIISVVTVDFSFGVVPLSVVDCKSIVTVVVTGLSIVGIEEC